MKYKKVILLVLCVGCIGFGAPVFSKSPNAEPIIHAETGRFENLVLTQGKILEGLIRLKFTDEQKVQAANILKEHQYNIFTAVDAFRQARQKLAYAIQDDLYNENAVREASKHLSSAQETLILLASPIINELRSLQTPEQRESLEKIKNQAKRRAQQQQVTVRSLLSVWIDTHSSI